MENKKHSVNISTDQTKELMKVLTLKVNNNLITSTYISNSKQQPKYNKTSVVIIQLPLQ